MAVLAVMAITLLSALAEGSDAVSSGKCGDDVTWTLDDDNVLTISGSGPMYNYEYDYVESEETDLARKDFKKVVIEHGVTSIGDNAFFLSNIHCLEIADSVTYIGEGAFAEGWYLETVVIPDSVTYLGGGAFLMQPLRAVVLPDTLSYIGPSTFSDTFLESIELPSTLTFIGDNLLQSTRIESIDIPSTATYIGFQAFAWCLKLTDVYIPPSVIQIKGGAFEDCTSLKSLTIPDSVTSIEYEAFAGCTGLEYVAIPDSVTSIGRDAFRDITFVDEFGNALTATVENLCGHVFEGRNQVLKRVADGSRFVCGGLVYETVAPDSNSVILVGSSEPIKNLMVPETVENGGLQFVVTAIGPMAFYGCSGLESVTIADSVTSIGTDAFKGIVFKDWSTVLSHDAESLTGRSFLGSGDTMYLVDADGYVHGLVEGASFVKNGIRYSIETISGGLSVSIIGYEGDRTSLTIPDGVNYDNWYFKVSSIAEDAFLGLIILDLAGNELPQTFDNLYGHTFRGADGILSFILDNRAFDYEGLRYFIEPSGPHAILCGYNGEPADVVIPASVTYMGADFEVTIIEFDAFYRCKTLKSVIMPDSITALWGDTFGECTSLKTVVLSKSLTEIATFTFDMCTSLTSVVIPDSVSSIRYNAFSGCKSLEYVDIPDSVTSIEGHAFGNCVSLKYVDIPDSVTSIGALAFYNCPSLSFLSVPSSVTAISNKAFMNITLKDEAGKNLSASVENLCGYVFEGGNNVLNRIDDYGSRIAYGGLLYETSAPDRESAVLVGYAVAQKNLVVPDVIDRGGLQPMVSAIGPKAFYGCSELKSADLGSVSEIGSKAFARCRMLASVDTGDSLKTIGSYAFYDCVRLRSLDLNGSLDDLRTIKDYAFYRTNLDSVSLPSDIAKIGVKALPRTFADENGSPLEKTPAALAGYVYVNVGNVLVRQPGAETGDEIASGGLVFRVTKTLPAEVEVVGFEGSPKNVAVPGTVSSGESDFRVVGIGDGAFKGCRSLRSVDAPHVERIGVKAFANCTCLRSITVGEGLETVGAYAFYRCLSLASFDAPESLSTIGSYAFYKCSALSDIDLGGSLKKVGKSAFGGLTFLDADGAEIPKTAEALRGHEFVGTDGVLQATA